MEIEYADQTRKDKAFRFHHCYFSLSDSLLSVNRESHFLRVQAPLRLLSFSRVPLLLVHFYYYMQVTATTLLALPHDT